MKNYIYIIMLSCIFQGCKSQNKNKNNFIYHTADYNFGIIQEERIYNSLTGLYEYKKYSDSKIEKNIKIFLKFNSKDLEAIYKLYSSSKSKMSDCYYENNMLTHKSTITFGSRKDNFNLIECNKDGNPVFIEIENKIEKNVTSSSIYKTNFYWEYYKK
ncbi:hypothetical protein ACQ7CX_11215 [Chryseobacterium arthrosphaerae]|uniref:hypothetical protein n=1 Tax=Chryseobacterium arthrosphaerae TaxID=651561 RepID=UPI001BAEE0A6|nr:hypothetical protein [Chryseobacterium arthrosphaerae]QUY54011.1 hypothetical protein I2F65_14060 [Chryseobacterium arthrosphaerae]